LFPIISFGSPVLPELSSPKQSVAYSGEIKFTARFNQLEDAPLLSGTKMKVEDSDQHAARRVVPALVSRSWTIFRWDMDEEN